MFEYSEFQKGREITINFETVCPYSSNNIHNQVCKQKKVCQRFLNICY